MHNALLPVLEAGITRLAGLDEDGAAFINDRGFSKIHVGIGHSLARCVGRWTAPQAVAALNICRFYHNGQLADLNIPEVDASSLITEEVKRRQEKVDAEILAATSEDADFGVKFGPIREVNTKLGLRHVKSGTVTEAFWAAWRSQKEALKAKGWSVSQFNGEWKVSIWATPNGASRRTEVPATPYTPYVPVKTEGLLAYQIPALGRLVAALQFCGSALDASDTGTGKTYIALAAVRELGKRAFVIAPKAVLPSWRRAAKHLGVEVEAINYELVRRGKTPHGKWLNETQFSWEGLPADSVLIFDEVHRCKGRDTQNSLLLQAARRQGRLTIGLSATCATNPLEMKAIGFLLGLHDGTSKGFWGWVRRWDCKPSRWGGFEFVGGAHTLARLHKEIFPQKGNRVRVADLGDAFPETSIHTQLVDLGLGVAEKVDKIFAEMQESLQELAERSQEDEGENHLTIRLRARQKVELLKVPAFVELADLAIEEGQSVAIFVNFNETLEQIVERLSDYSPVVIHGGQTAEERQNAIDSFNADKSRVIVANIRAGGVGVSLHDLNGNFPRHALISPSDSAIDVRQTLGRVWRAGGKTKSTQRILGVEGSIEEKVLANLERKLENLDSLNDGDLKVA